MSEQQHNDTPAKAIATGIDSQGSAKITLTGTIGDNYFLADLKDDMDFYRFQAGAGDRIEWKISADGYPWYIADLVFGGIVYDSNGNRLQNSTQTGLGTYAFILPADGLYYLAVWGALGRPFAGAFSDINPNLFPRSINNAVRVGPYSLSLELFDNTPNYPSFTGTAGADRLNGTTSADTLIGLAGDDTYTVNHSGDAVIEALNAGADLVQASISYNLPNHVEALVLTGRASINGSGNGLNNTITGNGGKNTLDGGAGNDIINGGADRDTLTGGTGSDIFLFRFGQSLLSAPDRITDFAIGSDRIGLLAGAGAATTVPTRFTRAANSTATTLASMVSRVFADANGALAGNQPLGANHAALVRVETASISGTYLVINDGVTGLQSNTDACVDITGFSGRLPAIGNLDVGSFFS